MKLNSYEAPTTKRGALNFGVDKSGRAHIPNGGAIRNIGEGFADIGREYGSVLLLATGQQIYPSHVQVSKYHILASGHGGMPIHHTVFHGNRELRASSTIDVLQQCPGVDFELDCGCRERMEGSIETIKMHSEDPFHWTLLHMDTPGSDTKRVLEGIYEATNVPPLSDRQKEELRSQLEVCQLRRELRENRAVRGVFKDTDGHTFIWTNNMPVYFRDGLPARLFIFREQPPIERKGYSQVEKVHRVLLYGDVKQKTPVVRYHSSCITSQYGGNGCDCKDELDAAIALIKHNGSGIILLSDEEGMGSGPEANAAQTWDTLSGSMDLLKSREDNLSLPGDLRDGHYGLIDIVLRQVIPTQRVIFASNNHSKRKAFERAGIQIQDTHPLGIDPSRVAPQAMRDAQAKILSGRYLDFS
jgi:GTP cyclohydrolase II